MQRHLPGDDHIPQRVGRGIRFNINIKHHQQASRFAALSFLYEQLSLDPASGRIVGLFFVCFLLSSFRMVYYNSHLHQTSV